MGSMKEKLEAVMNEWEKGIEMHIDMKAPLSKKLMDFISKNQNSTSLQITNYIMSTYPDTKRANISSILKQLADRNHLEREYCFDPALHRSSYKYSVPSETRRQELEAVRKAEDKASRERLEKMRKLAETARAAKADKAAKKEEQLKTLAAQRHEGTGIREALPAPKRNSAQEILDSLSITQAREVYDELKKIFGG